MTDRPSLTGTIGAFIAQSPQPPAETIERARINLVHNLSVALAARTRETVAHRVAVDGRSGPSTLIASGKRTTPDWAALANGALMAIRSQDDTHLASTSHPGAPITAAALAVAEARGASGRDFLDALVFGYETLGRIGRDFDKEVSARGFRAAAVWAGFGAAGAAARLRHLDGVAAGHALALVTHQAGGLLQVWREGSAEFPYHLGFGARNGVVAAELAAAGATAGRHMLEGEDGLYAAAAGVDRQPVEALEALGETWQVMEVTVKSFPCCAVLQGPMGLVLSLAEDIRGATVERCVLSLNPFEANFPGIDNPGPDFASATATKMSAQFCLGVGLLDGRLALDDLHRLTDPDILRLAARIAVERDEGLEERQCRIEMQLSDGRTLRGSVDKAVGQPDFDEARAFALRMAPEIGTEERKIARLVDEIERLHDAPNLDRLFAAVTAVGTESN
ncbi:MmgE/PrpD family protein [Oricola sp.]|uniref:MmgE/PrpD family protein n=1 Tax=Oricola sp. TaxID=1979950 RepID=UPI0025E9D1AF|nr:MmgE/PrpD family protein [Oricola sp.]MCI5074141.1 MmgE/PrpD family protein [Oricola sp.]